MQLNSPGSEWLESAKEQHTVLPNVRQYLGRRSTDASAEVRPTHRPKVDRRISRRSTDASADMRLVDWAAFWIRFRFVSQFGRKLSQLSSLFQALISERKDKRRRRGSGAGRKGGGGGGGGEDNSSFLPFPCSPVPVHEQMIVCAKFENCILG